MPSSETIFTLWLLFGNVEEPLARFDNPHSCAGRAAMERIALAQVETKHKLKPMKFICKETK